MMDVRPIRTKADHQAALAEIATLMNAEKGTPEGDRLDVLATLVEAYEAARIPIESPDPISAILFMMEQKQLGRRDLEPAIGTRARVAEVLNRRRALTLPMIRRLSHFLDIPADVLIQPYKIMQSRQRPRHKTKKSVQRQNRPAHAA
jgi:HTH-type transcriptional regulator / antitoxin HigA